MEWSREQVTLLIELYRERPVLWNQNLPDFKDKNKKHSAWSDMSEELKINKAELQTKMRYVVGQFYREMKKAKSGLGADTKSKWFAFEHLQFLRDKTHRHCRESGETKIDTKKQTAEGYEPQENTPTAPGQSSTAPSPTISSENPVPDTKRGEKRPIEDKRLDAAFSTLTSCASNMQRSVETVETDECSDFGNLVAKKLRNYDTGKRTATMHSIMGIFLNNDLTCNENSKT